MGQLFSRIFAPRPDQLSKGKEIGRGSYGEILEGTLGTRPVAIKRLHRIFRDYAEHNQEALEDILLCFRRECELLEKAKSPHVVEFLGVFNEEDSVLLVMELMYQTLQKYLKTHKGSLPLEKQLDICYQVSREGTILVCVCVCVCFHELHSSSLRYPVDCCSYINMTHRFYIVM